MGGGGEGKSLGRARPSITSTSTAKAEHEYEWKVRASQLSFLCVLCFLLFVLFFVFALASIVPQFSRPAGDRQRHQARTPSHARSCSMRSIQPPQPQYPPVFLCVFEPSRLCVKRSGRREVQVETISTQSRKAQCLKFAVLPSAGFSSRVAQDKNHERHETHEKRVKIEQEAAEETKGSLPLLPSKNNTLSISDE